MTHAVILAGQSEVGIDQQDRMRHATSYERHHQAYAAYQWQGRLRRCW